MPSLRNLIAIPLLLTISLCLKAQKPLIDSTTFDKWPVHIVDPLISNNGKFSLYLVHDPITRQDSLFITSLDGHWTQKFENVKSSSFTSDSRQVYFQRQDTLFLVNLNTAAVQHIDGLEGAYALLPIGENSDLLAYRLKRDPKNLTVKTTVDNEIKEISNVEK